MSVLALGALLALSLLQQQTDTVISLGGATRLAVEAPGGSITVTAWDRPEVRISAAHSGRTYVQAERLGSTLEISARARRGPATVVDYRISAPASLDLDLGGMYVGITVEGMNGDVAAETMQGDVRVVGGRGNVKVTSVQGDVVIEGAEGRVEVEAVSRSVRIIDCTGELYVESVGGSIDFENVRASVVEAGSVGGRIRYAGTIEDGGRYFFGNHGGTVEITVPAGTNATFSLASVYGTMQSNLPEAPERLQPGQRTSFSVGSGSALVEAETFGGRILIHRPAP